MGGCGVCVGFNEVDDAWGGRAPGRQKGDLEALGRGDGWKSRYGVVVGEKKQHACTGRTGE